MRVIAGKHRGLVLSSFKGEDIRPTSDRVKESLFQIIAGELDGARALDLFCGSGALGIEALSRGAREVWFNDSSPDSLALLKKNLLRAGESGTVTCLDYAACLRRASGKFDVIFSDPPYRMDVAGEILSVIRERELLRKDGLVVYESEREETVPEGWRAERRGYGRTKIFLFRRAV